MVTEAGTCQEIMLACAGPTDNAMNWALLTCTSIGACPHQGICGGPGDQVMYASVTNTPPYSRSHAALWPAVPTRVCPQTWHPTVMGVLLASVPTVAVAELGPARTLSVPPCVRTVEKTAPAPPRPHQGTHGRAGCHARNASATYCPPASRSHHQVVVTLPVTSCPYNWQTTGATAPLGSEPTTASAVDGPDSMLRRPPAWVRTTATGPAASAAPGATSGAVTAVVTATSRAATAVRHRR